MRGRRLPGTEAGGIYVAFDGTRRVYNQPDTLIETFMAAGPPALVQAFCDRENARTARETT